MRDGKQKTGLKCVLIRTSYPAGNDNLGQKRETRMKNKTTTKSLVIPAVRLAVRNVNFLFFKNSTISFLALNHHCSKSRRACSVKNRTISALYRLVSVSNTMWGRQLFASAFQKTGYLIDKIFRLLTENCDFKMAVIRQWSLNSRVRQFWPSDPKSCLCLRQ